MSKSTDFRSLRLRKNPLMLPGCVVTAILLSAAPQSQAFLPTSALQGLINV